jgi:hypothetical protein
LISSPRIFNDASANDASLENHLEARAQEWALYIQIS